MIPERVPGLWTAEESPMPVDPEARQYFERHANRLDWRAGKVFEIASTQQEKEFSK